MAKRKKHEPWGKAIAVTICFIALVILVSHLFFTLGLLSPYEKNGLNKVVISCDGKIAEITTQRFYGFEDFEIETFREYTDLPITQKLKCESASVDFQRRADLIDRFKASVMCGEELIGDSSSDISEISCDQVITIEVIRI